MCEFTSELQHKARKNCLNVVHTNVKLFHEFTKLWTGQDKTINAMLCNKVFEVYDYSYM